MIDETTCNDRMTDDRDGPAEDIFTSLHSGPHLQIMSTLSSPVINWRSSVRLLMDSKAFNYS